MHRTELQEAAPLDGVTLLQLEVALLRRKLEDAEKSEWAMREAYRSLEETHKPTDEDEAFERLAEAFATLEELQHYLSADFYNALADASNDLFSDTHWQSKPAMLREILPTILREHIEMQDAREAEEKAKAESRKKPPVLPDDGNGSSFRK